MIYVQFADSTDAVIIAYFSNAQDASAFPNQGTVAASDARWKTFYSASPLQSYLPAPTA
ncbi:hypothetical protein SAMN05443245_5261 [Paraburkholderia fungorum]|uniref:Uncharacterized protein n=1 Tax=Paraburkholderia fungorum TaxID=134537 RepID=A0A1H1IJ15_9BURK|nr:hypothetical protein [Paraburkholderia fungorum]SDR37747.1 hypothetical protein SAMN05443245_5261 [Paraburkholderia fungorum]